MMSLKDAVRADRAGDLASAASAYELLLLEGEAELTVLINLAILYWQATDFGLATAKGLTPAFTAHAAQRFPVLLAQAHKLFPEAAEPMFWTLYIRWADLGEGLSVERCREMLRQDPTALVPIMYLFSQSRGESNRDQAAKLLDTCTRDPTTKNRYIASVIEGVLKRRR